VDKEIQRIKREASLQHHQDLMNLKKMSSTAAEFSTYQPIESPYGYGNMDTLSSYQPGVGQGEGGPEPPPSDDWKYFDQEMIEAQRKRLYGDNYASAPDPTIAPTTPTEEKKELPKVPYRRRRAPKKEGEDEDENEEIYNENKEEDEWKEDEVYDPDVKSEDED